MRNICGSDHPGPHMLAWRDTATRGRRPLWMHISQALAHADTAEEEIVEALPKVRDILARARIALNGCSDEAGLVAVSDEEYAAARLVIESACAYMEDNFYREIGDYPDDRAAALALGDGRFILCCFAAVVAHSA